MSLRKRSPFKAAMCREDLQPIKAIQATNIDTTPPQKLIGIFYKAVTKPVQGRIMRNYKIDDRRICRNAGVAKNVAPGCENFEDKPRRKKQPKAGTKFS